MRCRYYCLARHASVVCGWDAALVGRILHHIPGVDWVRPPPDEEPLEQEKEHQPLEEEHAAVAEPHYATIPARASAREDGEERDAGPQLRPCSRQHGGTVLPGDSSGAAVGAEGAGLRWSGGVGAEGGEGPGAGGDEAGPRRLRLGPAGDGAGDGGADGRNVGGAGDGGERRCGIRTVSYVDLNRTRAKQFRHCRRIGEFLDPDGPGRWPPLSVPEKDLAKWKGCASPAPDARKRRLVAASAVGGSGRRVHRRATPSAGEGAPDKLKHAFNLSC